jgi:hypothetical protein
VHLERYSAGPSVAAAVHVLVLKLSLLDLVLILR